MAFSSMVLTSTVLVVLTAGSVYAQQVCEADHQCPNDRFCYGTTKVCAPCIVCAAYNRKNGLKYCAKEWEDCGDCLIGFASEDIKGAIQRGNCIKAAPYVYVDSPPPTVVANNMTTGIPQSVQIVIVVAIVLSLAISGTLYLTMKGRQRVGDQHPDVEGGCREVPDEPLLRPPNGVPLGLYNRDRPPPTANEDPPPYSRLTHSAQCIPASPSAPPSESSQDEAGITLAFTEKQEEKLQQAQPFHVPENKRFHPTGSHGEVESEEENDMESEAENASARSTPVNLHDDESTQPNEWTPGNQELHQGGSLYDSGLCNIAGSPSSSTASLDAPPPPLNFHGLFAHGQLVVQTQFDSSGADAGERPAKRFRADSGSHSASSSSSEDETHLGDPETINVLNLSSVRK